MKISVFGLGYVGSVTAACLARDGHKVIGVDVNPEKVSRVARGEPPVIEPGLGELLAEGVRAGRISATISAVDAVQATEVSLVSVATPSRPDGAPDLAALDAVCAQIGKAVDAKGSRHIVVIRSTVQPGTTQRCEGLIRQFAGAIPVHVAFNPEFLREGSAVADFLAPPYTIIGTTDPLAEQAVRELYGTIPAPVIVTEPAVAELVKLAANAWHATKICFANEIGRLAAGAAVSGRKVMDILVQDTKLNTSAAYLRPGFAFGGSCLPKDVRSLLHFARHHNVEVPLLAAIHRSNQVPIERAVERVLAQGKPRVGMLGLAFKPGSDDLRESPAVELAERLIGKGCDVRILDPTVHGSKLVGANRAYVEQHLPHLSKLLVADAKELVRHAELLLLMHDTAEFRAVVRQSGLSCIDLT
ncbi:MAG: UDP-glucose/GDP-mannose dehydrogenase family protein [Verrucomicrobiae bacterium]|nr:UDP-glucose/GDP-mannose dehydrogenase family protein [Verrucomicrobiae bacterium]